MPSCQAGAGWRVPRATGRAPGEKLHQPRAPGGSGRTKREPPGTIWTSPSGAITSSSQASATRRATEGRSGRSSPAPDMTSRTVRVPSPRTVSNTSLSRGQNSSAEAPPGPTAPVTTVVMPSSAPSRSDSSLTSVWLIVVSWAARSRTSAPYSSASSGAPFSGSVASASFGGAADAVDRPAARSALPRPPNHHDRPPPERLTSSLLRTRPGRCGAQTRVLVS
ncbi:hypothetical protein D8771_21525 [Streptomyces albus]|uniref:Uncharacterized protein n=1 Tax=Streptomyces albus TaxID=1888 RepID=A0A8H1QNA0_9ACTN|nr:hypothetical protein D8771_21525 [Streptomyces albus]